jgi:anti-anti-sigma regulatory factor
LHGTRQLAIFVNLTSRQRLSFQLLAVGARLAFETGRNGMLRVRRKANGDVLFTLSGRIDKEHIAELEALIGAEGKNRRIVLDLKDVTLTGQDGIVFLARCEAAGIALVNCDTYIREWIARQGTGS